MAVRIETTCSAKNASSVFVFDAALAAVFDAAFGTHAADAVPLAASHAAVPFAAAMKALACPRAVAASSSAM